MRRWAGPVRCARGASHRKAPRSARAAPVQQARWLGRVLGLLLGAAGGVLSLLTANGGGVLSLIGLIFCSVVVVVFAFRWRVPAQT